MPELKRHTAYKVSIKQIRDARYVQPTEEPAYLDIEKQKTLRVNIIGIVVSKETQDIVIDDGTGSINLKLFEQTKYVCEIGDVVVVIAKPRNHDQQNFLVPEIIKKIESSWLDFRKKELSFQPKPKKTIPQKTIQPEKTEMVLGQENPNIILDLIKKHDKGTGVAIETIIKESGLKDAEKQIQLLINEGEIFELKPGKLQTL